MLLLIDNLSVKLALNAELLIITLLLALPVDKFGPYSRGLLEKQLVGLHWLLNGKVGNIPEEAKRVYKSTGLIFLILICFIFLSILTDLLKQLLL